MKRVGFGGGDDTLPALNESCDPAIHLVEDYSSVLAHYLDPNVFSHVVIVSDEQVAPLYAESVQQTCQTAKLSSQLITIPVGESAKTRAMKQSIEDQMLAAACGRDTLLIALGGGVVTDLAGFVAATYCRGIPVIYLPTSLLAMVDAAIGGKTGVNTSHGKNLIGCFKQPWSVIINVSVLASLPEQAYRFAFAEIIKHALIADQHYFQQLEQLTVLPDNTDLTLLTEMIQTSCQIKQNIVSSDQCEQHQREVLNFGHTFGHALERVTNYQVSHGQAVAWGMLGEACLAVEQGLLAVDDFQRINALLRRFGLLESMQFDISMKDFLGCLQYDKKVRQQQLRFVLLTGIGSVYQVDQCYAQRVDLALVQQVITTIFRFA